MKTAIRLGFATNSSSTHSILLANNQKQREHILNHVDNFCRDEVYGWEFFLLNSKRAKASYFGAQIANLLEQEGFSEDRARELACSTLGISQIGGIDHQSQYPLPQNGSKEFIELLQKWVGDPNVFVAGGNDNGDEGGEPAWLTNFDGQVLDKYILGEHRKIAVKTTDTGFSIFNQENGTKFRYNIEKSTFPELVDLKITDYCDENCWFCYQGSTPQGKHAPLDTIADIIEQLGSLGTFEIALGGGDPVSHPDFRQILQLCKDNHIIPSTSTKNQSWLLYDLPALAKDSLLGNVAVSLSRGCPDGEVRYYAPFLDKYFDYPTFHYIVGLYNEESFVETLDEIRNTHSRIVLLGAKPPARSQATIELLPSYKFYKVDWQFLIKDRLEDEYIALDSMLAKEFVIPPEVNPSSVVPEDGKFSMYIDAVTGIAGKSSYEPETFIPFTTVKECWDKISNEK